MCMRSVPSRARAHMHALIVPDSLVLAFVARLSINSLAPPTLRARARLLCISLLMTANLNPKRNPNLNSSF
jgi:hypothetical protein